MFIENIVRLDNHLQKGMKSTSTVTSACSSGTLNHISAPHRLQLLYVRLGKMTHWGIIQKQIWNQVQDQAGHARPAVQQSLEGAADAAERNISPTPHPACRACPPEEGGRELPPIRRFPRQEIAKITCDVLT